MKKPTAPPHRTQGHAWHHVARRSSGLVTLLAAELGLAPDAARELIRLGAVAVDGIRVVADVAVRAKARVSAYPQPRRFPAAFGDWRLRPVFDRPELAIFAKPHGVPTVATADNGAENALAGLEAAHGTRFYVTHRLDTAAAGLLLVAKTPDAQARLDGLFRERLVDKEYRLLAPAGLSTGEYRHFLAPGAPPRAAAAEAPGGDGRWEEALLRVESSKPFAAERYPKNVAEYHVRLITGRTHQIRAQFKALGFPLVGDKTYGGKGALPRPFPRTSIALAATALRFEARGFGKVEASIVPEWRA